IAPRAGLLRVREFTLAEIEHFVSPTDKSHPRFPSVADLSFLLYPRAEQLGPKQPVTMRLGDAVEKGIINNETLGYFIGRTFHFLSRLGIDPQRLRFRQHLQHEMAHYATDCWDAEIECSYGWVECVGLADRSAFDLKAHTEKSKVELVAYEKFPEPREVEVMSIVPSKKDIGKAFKRDAKLIAESLEAMTEAEALAMKAALEADGKVEYTPCGGTQAFSLTREMVAISREKKKLQGQSFTPSVIEPSFGIGRIIYCIYEHSFYARPSADEARTVFRFTPLVAPIKCTVFPLVQRGDLEKVAQEASAGLTKAGVANKIDTTGTTIGKRYARTDELGCPFAITVDGQTLEDGTVTLRERDSTAQVRIHKDEVASVVRQLADGLLVWTDVQGKYPAVAQKEAVMAAREQIDVSGAATSASMNRSELPCVVVRDLTGSHVSVEATCDMRVGDVKRVAAGAMNKDASLKHVIFHKVGHIDAGSRLKDSTRLVDIPGLLRPGSATLASASAATPGTPSIRACSSIPMNGSSRGEAHASGLNSKPCGSESVPADAFLVLMSFQRKEQRKMGPVLSSQPGGTPRLAAATATLTGQRGIGTAVGSPRLLNPIPFSPSAHPPYPCIVTSSQRFPPNGRAQTNAVAANKGCAVDVVEQRASSNPPELAALSKDGGAKRNESAEVDHGSQAIEDFLSPRDGREDANSTREQDTGTVVHTGVNGAHGIRDGITDNGNGAADIKDGSTDTRTCATDIRDRSSTGGITGVGKDVVASKVERLGGRKRKAERGDEQQAAGRVGLPHSVAMLDSKFGLLAAVYGFLEQRAVKATWKRLEVALKDLGSGTEGDAVTLQGKRYGASLYLAPPCSTFAPHPTPTLRLRVSPSFVVVDEAHAYRGAFGCHAALIFRRLRRLCAHVYGSDPIFIVCSATCADPKDHVRALLGVEEVVVVDGSDDGSPCGRKSFVLWNPPITMPPVSNPLLTPAPWISASTVLGTASPLDPASAAQLKEADTAGALGLQVRWDCRPIVEVAPLLPEMVQHDSHCLVPFLIRLYFPSLPTLTLRPSLLPSCPPPPPVSPIVEVALLLAEMVQHDLRCLAFCNTRKLSELVLTYTTGGALRGSCFTGASVPWQQQAQLAIIFSPSSPPSSLPPSHQDRRRIERELFHRRLQAVAATSALELGVDVGALDAAPAPSSTPIPSGPAAYREGAGSHKPFSMPSPARSSFPPSHQDRRRIERELFHGRLRAVAATSALELGVDVGALDATLHLGFHGSTASLWQQAGRAGRREKASLSIYVAFDGPLDQYFMAAPDRLFSRPIERCQLDAENPLVMRQQLQCAAAELPLLEDVDGRFFGPSLAERIAELAGKGALGRSPENPEVDRGWRYIGAGKRPALFVPVRAIDPNTYAVVEARTGRVLEEIEESKAFFVLYEGAVYLQQGRTFLVTSLDLEKREARCVRADVRYYTKTIDMVTVTIKGGTLAFPYPHMPSANPASASADMTSAHTVLKEAMTSAAHASAPSEPMTKVHMAAGGVMTSAQTAPCEVTTRWIGYRKMWRGSGEPFETVEMTLPDVTYATQAVWVGVAGGTKAAVEAAGSDYRASLHAAAHALANMAPLFLACMASDMGVECASPYDSRFFPQRLLLYDKHPGGIGLAVQV
ncbi:unnamed protein product, partial [Closterium sp. Yama58-4]